MKLEHSELKKLYWGALRFEETADGYLQGFQYTREQEKYFERVSDFWFERCTASNAKTLEFVTGAETFSFEYRMIWKGSEDSVELWVDSVATDIRYVKDMQEEGSLQFTLPKGKKHVTVYLPADATMQIRNFEIGGTYEIVKKKEKVLWLGDSITQGYGTLRSGHTYVSVANRILNYDIINQGIGGYVYDPDVLVKMGDYKPDKIIVAMGTNQFGTESMEDIEIYYERLRELYGNIPVLSVLPLWRGDVEGGEPTLISFREKLKAICEKYDNITIVDGFQMVPHLEEYYLDKLHPNCLGAEMYGRNLVLEIQKAGF